MRQRLTKEPRQSGAPEGPLTADRVVVVFDTIAIFVAKMYPKSITISKVILCFCAHPGNRQPGSRKKKKKKKQKKKNEQEEEGTRSSEEEEATGHGPRAQLWSYGRARQLNIHGALPRPS
jgi:hypothetical protein